MHKVFVIIRLRHANNHTSVACIESDYLVASKLAEDEAKHTAMIKSTDDQQLKVVRCKRYLTAWNVVDSKEPKEVHYSLRVLESYVNK